MQRPEYFTQVQNMARSRWVQLESDPGLAAPWHQLFRQVQSPRHVLSELLQNADDAKATWAKATLGEKVFEFIHNGDDFDEQSLESLCQFGLSNKRHLHTIGFRGVGFKSVFSLGDRVEVITPTLSFAFDKKRFTEPIWISNDSTSGETIIRVEVTDELKSETILNDFGRWIKSPFPLLFFNTISHLEIQDQVIRKHILRDGPTNNSKYVRLESDEEREVLLVESIPAEFPSDAVEEIREERGSSEIALPPCSVQIILDAQNDRCRLYTVLPTDVEPSVPFSMNGPFIQDPARREIKHPANSPTNRWLLKRIGELASATMREWLQNQSLTIKERAQAYGLLPSIIKSEEALQGVCTDIILKSFSEDLGNDRKLLIGFDSKLYEPNKIIGLDSAVLKTWSHDEAVKIFSQEGDRALAPDVESSHRQKLREWKLLKVLGLAEVSERLRRTSLPFPPRPTQIENLLFLWEYLSKALDLSLNDYIHFRVFLEDHAIVPVHGHDELLPVSQVMTLGGQESVIPDDDWEFLVSKVNVLQKEWINIISIEEKKDDQMDNETEPEIRVKRAQELFNKLNLNQRVGLEQLIRSASKKIMDKANPGNDGVRIAQIASFADVRVQEDFKYLCIDSKWREARQDLLISYHGDLENLLPFDCFSSQVISTEYIDGLAQDKKNKWFEWTKNESKSLLNAFPLPQQEEARHWSKYRIVQFALEHGGHEPSYYYYQNEKFITCDYDWNSKLWSFWNKKGLEDPLFWRDLVKAVINDFSQKWQERCFAEVRQCHGNHKRKVYCGTLHAKWIQKLKNIRCIPDTYGNLDVPAQLFRSTPETQPLVNVERFVHQSFDKPEYSKTLDLLGVRNTPTGVASLIERLKALSQVTEPPVSHLIDLYRAIDKVLLRLDTQETKSIKEILGNQPLIYTAEGQWVTINDVYRKNPDKIPGVCLIHREANNLAIWDRMEVTVQPTIQMAIEWLKNKSFGEKLVKNDKERTIQIIRRAPSGVWNTCEGWLDITGAWVSVNNLVWATANLKIGENLFDNIKRKTADFSMLDDMAGKLMNEWGLKSLEYELERRPLGDVAPSVSTSLEWLTNLGSLISRFKDFKKENLSEEETQGLEEDRITARRLAETKWATVTALRIVSYINDEPAGPETSCKIMWKSNTIYATGKPSSLYRELVEELSRHFKTQAVRRIVYECVDRDPLWLADYAHAHMELLDEVTQEIIPQKESEKLEVLIKKAPQIITITKSEDKGETEIVQPVESIVIAPANGELNDRVPRHDRSQDLFNKHMKESGFEWSENREAYIKNGAVIKKADKLFNWVEYNMEGSVVKCYWISSGSLELGVEVPSEVWNFEQNNCEVCMILKSDSTEAKIYHLSDLKMKQKRGEIEMFSSKMIVREVH